MRRPPLRVAVPVAEPVDVSCDIRFENLCWKFACGALLACWCLTMTFWTVTAMQLKQAMVILEHRK